MNGQTQGSRADGTALGWIGDVLGWSFGPGGKQSRRYWGLPSREAPRILVPAGRGARGALATFNDSVSQAARLKKIAFGTYLGLGPPWAPGASPLEVSEDADGAGEPISTFLEKVLGEPIDLGVTIGRSLRPNRKPVLQIVDTKGRIVAFAKIGWNEHTRALVDAEARTLAQLQGAALSFRIPEAIHHGDWRGRSVLVVSTGPPPGLRRRGWAAPPIRAELDVARSHGWDRASIGSSAYLSGLRSRIADPGVSPATASRLAAWLDGFVDRDGDREVWFGAWHGDWAPWNMIRSGTGLFVMDWERYAGPVPVGFDHLHLRFQRAFQGGGSSVEAAGGTAAHSLRRVAGAVSVDPADVPALLHLYLLEPLLRTEIGRAAGMRTNEQLVPTILDHLERTGR